MIWIPLGIIRCPECQRCGRKLLKDGSCPSKDCSEILSLCCDLIELMVERDRLKEVQEAAAGRIRELEETLKPFAEHWDAVHDVWGETAEKVADDLKVEKRPARPPVRHSLAYMPGSLLDLCRKAAEVLKKWEEK